MSSLARVTIHASQFPENVRRDLRESLRTRRVNHKFHYDSAKQTQQWLALHQAYSPSRTDPDCAAVYNTSFEAAAKRIGARRVHLIGLGCGGGQKDTRLLKLLKARGAEISYAPCDVSTTMVLTARQTALTVLPEKKCFPLVCDLATADDLPDIFSQLLAPRAPRLISFFSMIPNFEPQLILPKLAGLIRPRDFLLFSANLALGSDCGAGLKKILPQYDNPLTRDWLMTFLLDFGVEQKDGRLHFSVEDGQAGLKRVVARFHFQRAREFPVDEERFTLTAGDTIRLFFSYRYTLDLVRRLLCQHGIEVLDQWVTKSEEEGVFLCRKSKPLRSSAKSAG